MKNKLLTSLLLIPMCLLTGCDSTSYKPKELDPNVKYDDVYLIMGQSNASGVSEHKYLKDVEPELYETYSKGNNKVLISYDVIYQNENEFVPTKFGFGDDEQYFGPEIGIADVLSKKESKSYIIKATLSASCLQNEYVSNKGKKLKRYNYFLKFIKKQLKALEANSIHPRVRGMFWMQGESDSFFDFRYKYDIAEQYFLDYIRHDLNNWIYEYFNFVDAYIFTKGVCWVEPEVINACKQKVCDSNEHCYCIKTNGEDETAITLDIKSNTNEENDLAHYCSKSMLLLGRTAGSYLIK